MQKYKFNQPLLLINNKPIGEKMLENGYAFYMYPIPTIQYANKVLTGNELKLYLAISGQAGKDNTGKPLHWAISHYCNIADIDSKHYAPILNGLCKKGFIIHSDFESLEVLYPISENEYISKSGKIQTMQDSQKGIVAEQENESINEDYSQNGKGATEITVKSGFQKMKEESQKEEEKSLKGSLENDFRNIDSQFYGNNREIDKNIKGLYRVEKSPTQKEQEEIEEIRKEQEQEERYGKKALILVKQIGTKFNIMEKVLKQFYDLQSKYGNQYIYYGLKNKSIEEFSMGIGLLFKEMYHLEVQQIVMLTEELKDSKYSPDFLEETEEEKQELEKEQRIQELSKMSFSDLL